MSRRRTRKVNKTRPKTRSRKLGGGGVIKQVGAMAGATVAALLKLIAPLKPLSLRVLAWAWQSRDVRRAAGVAGGAAVLVCLSWVMLGNLGSTARYTIDPARIELTAEPSWASGALAARVKAEIETGLRNDLSDLTSTSAFDDDVMAVVSERIERNAWVQRVVRIDRRFPTGADGTASLQPTIEVRRPALLVESADCYWVVDGEGVVLPLTIKRDAEQLKQFRSGLTDALHIVRGVDGQAPAAGTIWKSEQLQAALSMERVVRRAQLDKSMPIEAIELVGVPQRADERGRVFYPPDGAVVLIPDARSLPDTRVIWGRPPVHASTLELSANDKLDELKRHLDKPDSLPGARIDLRRRGT